MLDIGEESVYPASELSNFTKYEFTVDGVLCNSMEGFLQSLKFKEIEKQKEVCLLVGKKAKFKGKKKKWWLEQTLYWQGQSFHRQSNEYQQLLDKAFFALSKNESFQRVLLDTKEEMITHSIGKSDPSKTILTEEEFCCRLMRIRDTLTSEKTSF